MWFKQASLFQLNHTFDYQPELLAKRLEPLSFSPCLPGLPISYGWVPPIEQDNAPLVHAVNGMMLICLQLQTKILPAVVVKQTLDQRIKQLVSSQQRKISQKEKQNLKEDITQSLLPQAFSKYTRIYGFIDCQHNWLVVDSTTASQLEKYLDIFKKAFGERVCQSIKTKKIAPLLTHWLRDNTYPKSFDIEKACVLRDPNQQSRVIRAQQQDLLANGFQSLLEDNVEVHQLALNWQDKVSFTLVDDFSLKSIRYKDEILEVAKSNYSESWQQQFDADFFIMSETLQQLISELASIFIEFENLSDSEVAVVA